MAYISLEHVNKKFVTRRSTIYALKDINMHFNKGEFVSIVGPSGCGKSTIIRLIDDIIKPSSGTITVDLSFRCLTCTHGLRSGKISNFH